MNEIKVFTNDEFGNEKEKQESYSSCIDKSSEIVNGIEGIVGEGESEYAMNNEYNYKYDRSTERVKRDKKEIGISAARGGTIVGDHDVIFAGADEVITFSHTAYSKAIFGKGAVQAAKFLAGKQAGMYDMGNVIDAQM